MFKKTEDSNIWVFEKTINRRRYQFRVGKHLPTAKDLADKIDAYILIEGIDKAILKYKNGVSNPDSGAIPLIGEIVDKYMLLATGELGVQRSSVVAYCNALLQIIDRRKALSELTHSRITDYKVEKLRGIEDQEDIKARKRSINSVIRNAKSLFGKDAIKLYKGWNMSFAEPLMEAPYFKRVRKVYRLPPSQLVKSTFHLCDYYEMSNPDSFTILGLALYFGLRRNEIFNARRSWIEIPEEGLARAGVFSERSFNVKSGEDGYAFGSAVSANRILDASQGFDYLVSNRSMKSAFKPVITDLRNLGWGEKCKPLHECRKLYGSHIATTQSLYHAQKSLRHASAMTTNDFYADLMTDSSVLQLWAS